MFDVDDRFLNITIGSSDSQLLIWASIVVQEDENNRAMREPHVARLQLRSKRYRTIKHCLDYLSAFAGISQPGSDECKGGILERLVYTVIDVYRSLPAGLLAIPYLRPYQLDACMEHTVPTLRLHVYIYARMSKHYSHEQATEDTSRLLGWDPLA
ncbi:hypothetical protein F4778DRAFT_735829 [Xylariomycetidae sp. FL2044]|nr:hypothetical protein F4778DRAFT_735829 [Xylariomycetidae sp. FL2044]